jgi:UPF0755 protein
MRRVIRAIVVVALLGIAGAGAVAWLAWSRMQAPFKGYGDAEQFVDVPQGARTAAIGERLVHAGVISDPRVFRVALWWSGQARSLKAGEYRFDAPMTVFQVIDRLSRGEVFTRRVTFPEGLTIAEMAAVYATGGFGTAAEFEAAARNAALITDLDPAAPDLEGYLFPDTYAVPRVTRAETMVALMVGGFRAAYSDDLRRKAAEQGLTTRQVMTLASIVEKETAKAEERPVVAAVYRNRVRIKMGLQADPTVVYALRKAGRYDGNIRRTDLMVDSPYNTYRYAGLPPGPIAAPGQASIAAAVSPADVPYLYFVSRNDGSHVFAETLAQHNRNVAEFQVRYFQQRQSQRRRAAR